MKLFTNTGVTVTAANAREEQELKEKGFKEVDENGNPVGIEKTQLETELETIVAEQTEKIETMYKEIATLREVNEAIAAENEELKKKVK